MGTQKQISFDLDTNLLKQLFGENNYTKAYKDIKKIMQENGYSHIEGSVYMSNEPKGTTSVR